MSKTIKLRKIRKSRKTSRKSSRKSRKTARKSTKKIRKSTRQKGGREEGWSRSSEFPADEVCSICLEKLSTQPVVYTTECEHTFHNNCLNDSCDHRVTCPYCRRNIENDCNSVYAFKEHVLGRAESPNTPYFVDKVIRDFYDSQTE